MDGVIQIIIGVDPVSILVTIIGGIAIGYLFKDIYFPWKIIVLWTSYWLPFYFSRAFFIAATGPRDSGLVGFMLTFIYFASSYVSRKVSQKFFHSGVALTLDTAELDVDLDNK